MKLLDHASPVGGIEVLEPRVSNHGDRWVYFSGKRENTLVYLSNAVEKFCKEAGFQHAGVWRKWGPYGFTPDGRLRLEEYSPDALRDTYSGVSAYIYTARQTESVKFLPGIPGAFYSCEPVPVEGCEVISDAYAEILKAQEEGKITIVRDEDWTPAQREGLKRMIAAEYEACGAQPDYQHFLEYQFPWLKR